MPTTVSNPWNMTCREQVLYWLAAMEDAFAADNEEEFVNAGQNMAEWIMREQNFGPDAVVPDLAILEDE